MTFYVKYRPAIAMIELIFAIVVMGIVMLSAPMLLTTTSQSGYTAIQQEGINEASTQMIIMMDYPWDENDTNSSYPPVLNVSNGDSELAGILPSPKRRVGTPSFSNRIFISFDGSEFNASTIGLDTGETITTLDDIDDFNGTSINLKEEEASVKDYIEKQNQITISRTVTYMSDTATNYANAGGTGTLTFTPTFTTSTSTTNIKRLQTTLTSTSGVSELSKTITLHAFACNIGTQKLEER